MDSFTFLTFCVIGVNIKLEIQIMSLNLHSVIHNGKVENWIKIKTSHDISHVQRNSDFCSGRSRTVRDQPWSCSIVLLAVCFSSLSCWKVSCHPSLRWHALWSRFSSRTYLYLAAFILATARQYSRTLPQLRWYYPGIEQYLGCQSYASEFCSKRF